MDKSRSGGEEGLGARAVDDELGRDSEGKRVSLTDVKVIDFVVLDLKRLGEYRSDEK